MAGLFFLAGADFVGAMQLMVYVGGTLVLLVFGVMLTARDRSSPAHRRPANGSWPMLVGGLLAAVLLQAVLSVKSWSGRGTPSSRPGTRLDRLAADGHAAGPGPAGRPRRSPRSGDPASRGAGMAGYLLVFEIISVHLLVVLVGAAYLARAKRDGGKCRGGRPARRPRTPGIRPLEPLIP